MALLKLVVVFAAVVVVRTRACFACGEEEGKSQSKVKEEEKEG